MGVLLVLSTRWPTRTSFRIDARAALWAYGAQRSKSAMNQAARRLLDVSRAPSCIPGWRIERDETTSRFRLYVTREIAPSSGATFASAAR